MRQRRHVEGDSHFGGRYSKLTKWMPSRRSSRPPGTVVGVDREPRAAADQRNGHRCADAGDDRARHAVRAHRLPALEQTGVADQGDANGTAVATAPRVRDDPAGPRVVRVQPADARHRTHGPAHLPEVQAEQPVRSEPDAVHVEGAVCEDVLRAQRPSMLDGHSSVVRDPQRVRRETARLGLPDVVDVTNSAVEELVLPDGMDVCLPCPDRRNPCSRRHPLIDPVFRHRTDCLSERVARDERRAILDRPLRSDEVAEHEHRQQNCVALRHDDEQQRCRERADRREDSGLVESSARGPRTATTARARACPTRSARRSAARTAASRRAGRSPERAQASPAWAAALPAGATGAARSGTAARRRTCSAPRRASPTGSDANAATSRTSHDETAAVAARYARCAGSRLFQETTSTRKATSGTTPRYRSSSATCHSSHFATLARE